MVQSHEDKGASVMRNERREGDALRQSSAINLKLITPVPGPPAHNIVISPMIPVGLRLKVATKAV